MGRRFEKIHYHHSDSFCILMLGSNSSFFTCFNIFKEETKKLNGCQGGIRANFLVTQ